MKTSIARKLYDALRENGFDAIFFSKFGDCFEVAKGDHASTFIFEDFSALLVKGFDPISYDLPETATITIED